MSNEYSVDISEEQKSKILLKFVINRLFIKLNIVYPDIQAGLIYKLAVVTEQAMRLPKLQDCELFNSTLEEIHRYMYLNQKGIDIKIKIINNICVDTINLILKYGQGIITGYITPKMFMGSVNFFTDTSVKNEKLHISRRVTRNRLNNNTRGGFRSGTLSVHSSKLSKSNKDNKS